MGSAAIQSRIARAVAVLMIAGAVMCAWAESKPEESKEAKEKQPKDVPAALSMIGSDEYNRREAATDYLMHQSADALPQVEKRLEKEKDPEAIERLSRVALHLFMKDKTSFEGRSGMIGIQFTVEVEIRGKYQDEMRPVIVVADILPGFPAAEHLKIGDRIIGMEGTVFPAEFNEIRDFQSLIAQKKPGTKVILMVDRGNEIVNATIALAGLKDVDGMSMPTIKSTRESMAASYLSGLKNAGEKKIEVPGDPNAWDTNTSGGSSGWQTPANPDAKDHAEFNDKFDDK